MLWKITTILIRTNCKQSTIVLQNYKTLHMCLQFAVKMQINWQNGPSPIMALLESIIKHYYFYLGVRGRQRENFLQQRKQYFVVIILGYSSAWVQTRRTMSCDSLPDFIMDPSVCTDSFRRLLKTYLHDTSACSALEVDDFMRYINILTYLLT